MNHCAHKGCQRQARRKSAGSLCEAHYTRKRKGRPMDAPFLTTKGTGLRLIDEAVTYNGDACLIWPLGKMGCGRGAINVDGKITSVARLVCARVHGDPPTTKHEAAHKCGKGLLGCYAPNHLYWATSQENKRDKLLHGTDNRGEKHPLAQLTDDDARHIFQSAKSASELAEMFGVSVGVIGKIKRRERYVHAIALLDSVFGC